MKLNLSVKVNVMVVVVLGLLLATILVVLNRSLSSLTTRLGRERATQHVAVIQRQLDAVQQELMASAQLLATAPELLEAIRDQDKARSRTTILLNANQFDFDAVTVVDPANARLVSTGSSTAAEVAQEDRLLSLALLNISVSGAIVEPEQGHVSLAVVTPLNDAAQQRLGVLLARHALDQSFLDKLNSVNEDVDLALILQKRVLAQSLMDGKAGISEDAHTTTFLRDQAAIDQALRGQIVVSDELVQVDNAAHALAYMPVSVQGQTIAVLGILVDVAAAATFQNQLTINLTIIFTLLALGAIGAMALFVRRDLTSPLRRLKMVAEQIAAGDYQQRAVVTSRDEIGQLGTALNTTTRAVQEREAALQQTTTSLEQRRVELEGTLRDLRQSIRERDQLSESIRELASPVLPVLNGIIVMPLIGVIDTERATLLTQTLLTAIEQHQARTVIMDVTGVPIIDTQVARVLLQAADAARLLGTVPLLVGLRPELAQTIVGLGLDLRGLVTHADLQSGILYAMRQRVTHNNTHN